MSKLLSLENSSVPQPCLGHPLVPACLRLQKCFITNINYHSGFITAFPSSFCLCCLETMLKATSTRSITHLGTNNWDEGRWSREDLFAEGRFSAPWQEPETAMRTQEQRAEHQDGRPDTEQREPLAGEHCYILLTLVLLTNLSAVSWGEHMSLIAIGTSYANLKIPERKLMKFSL